MLRICETSAPYPGAATAGKSSGKDLEFRVSNALTERNAGKALPVDRVEVLRVELGN
jgi:hypothetical protein